MLLKQGDMRELQADLIALAKAGRFYVMRVFNSLSQIFFLEQDFEREAVSRLINPRVA